MDKNIKTLRFVCVSDTHGLTDDLKVPEGDVLIHAGDFSNIGEPEIVEEFNKWLGTQPHPIKIVIAGNHDISFDTENYSNLYKVFHSEIPPIDCKKTKALLTNCTYLEDSSVKVHGYNVYGSPWSPYFYGWAFNAQRGPEIRAIWDKIPTDTDILITHGPPLGFGDIIESKEHVGCKDLLDVIKERVKPLVNVFGHIHEGYGVEEKDGVKYINASICTLQYRPSNKPIIFELPVKE